MRLMSNYNNITSYGTRMFLSLVYNSFPAKSSVRSQEKEKEIFLKPQYYSVLPTSTERFNTYTLQKSGNGERSFCKGNSSFMLKKREPRERRVINVGKKKTSVSGHNRESKAPEEASSR